MMDENENAAEEIGAGSGSQTGGAWDDEPAKGGTSGIANAANDVKNAPSENVPEAHGASRRGSFCAYIGPTIPGSMTEGTVISGGREDAEEALRGAGLPEHAVALAMGLVVDGDGIMAALKEMKVPGSIAQAKRERIAAELASLA
jgi:hypothetical protein